MRRLFQRRRRFLIRLGLVLAVALLGLGVLAGSALAAQPGASTSTADLGDDLASWAALVGIVLPALTAVLQRDTFPSWVNTIIFGFAVVAASVVYGFVRFGHNFDWAHWEAALLAIVVWGVGTYHAVWSRGTESVIKKVRALPNGAAPS